MRILVTVKNEPNLLGLEDTRGEVILFFSYNDCNTEQGRHFFNKKKQFRIEY